MSDEKENKNQDNLESKVVIGPLQLFESNATTLLTSMSFAAINSSSQPAIIKDPNNTNSYTASVSGPKIVSVSISYNSGIGFWVLYVQPNSTNPGNTTVIVSDGVRTIGTPINIVSGIGPLALYYSDSVTPLSSMSFTSPTAVSQPAIIKDPYNQASYTSSVSGPAIVSTNISYNSGIDSWVIYVQPNNTGSGNTTVVVSDGVRTANIGIAVTPNVGPLLVSPTNIGFQNNFSSPTTCTISDPNNVSPITITPSTPNIVSVNYPGGNQFTITPIGQGNTTLTVSDGIRNAQITIAVQSYIYPVPVISSLSATSGCISQNITVTGSNFSALRDTATVNNTPAVLVVQSANIAIVTIPSTAAGYTYLRISDGVSTTVAQFEVIGQPIITSIYPAQPTINDSLIIYGNNFGDSTRVSGVFINGVSIPFSVPNPQENPQAILTSVSSSTPLGPNQLYVQTICGDSSLFGINVVTTASLTITPITAVVSQNTTKQFTATFYAYSSANPVNVTNSSIWQVNGVTGGEGTHGAISTTGVYTAPLLIPSTQIVVTAIYDDTELNINLTSQAVVNLSAVPQVVISPSNITLQPGQTQQYVITFVTTVNDVVTQTDITNNSGTNYSVNGTTNGDNIDGFITTGGLYTAPGNFPTTTQINITASYLYQGQLYVGNAIATVEAVSSNYANITVNSQLNIYLGDGRFGYVPAGTQVIAYPNQYIFVQFAELLNSQNFLPDPTYLPVQQLSFGVKNALDPDIANVIYNLGDMTLNSDGTTNTLRTVVLGIIDPSDGLFHSMWDINNPLPSSSNFNLPHSMLNDKLTKLTNKNISNISGDITNYIDKLAEETQQKIDVLNSRSTIMLAGTCSYDNQTNTFKIIDNIHILGILGDNTYGTFGIIPKQEIKVEPNQFIYIDSEQNLKVENFSIIFDDAQNVKNIVVGAVLDDFYTTWPLIKKLEINISNVNELNKNSYVEIGPMTVQWGTIEEQFTIDKKSTQSHKIQFVKKYEKSCTVLLNTQNSTGGIPQVEANNITTENFDAKFMNLGSTNIKTTLNYLAIGI